MFQYITDLLLLHDCVIVPNFGGFIGNPASAELNSAQHIISPPYKRIAFNINLNSNDGLLTNYIVNCKGISFTEANIEIVAFVENLKHTLKQEKHFVFHGLGVFNLDSENILRFEPSRTVNFLIDSYGLQSVQSLSIKRDKINRKASSTLLSDRNPIANTSPVSIKRIVRNTAIALPLVAIGLWLAFQGNGSLKNSSYSSFNPFDSSTHSSSDAIKHIDPVTTAIPPVTAPKNTTREIIDITPVTKITAQKTRGLSSNTNSDRHGNYVIIAGCFENIENAENLVEELKAKGYPASLHGKRKGLHIVSYQTFNSKKLAENKLAQINNSGMDGWLLAN